MEHARASGVSYGTYLASLIDGAPYPGGLADAVRALMASTDQMASYSTDFQAFLGLIRKGDPPRHRGTGRRSSGSSVRFEAHEVDRRLGRRGAARRPAQADGGKSVLRKEPRHGHAFSR